MPKNSYIAQQLVGIQAQLLGAYQADKLLSSATKGHERETFINSFLSEVFPTPFRFGTGDVTDITGGKSGQLDVVIEYPFFPSLPIVGSSKTRLYLAESIAAVVEVKSDVCNQWAEAISTAQGLKHINRSFGSTFSFGPVFHRIPLFIVGYSGWKKLDTIRSNLLSASDSGIDGVLVIDQGLFVSSSQFGLIEATGPFSLWGLMHCLNLATQSLKSASPNALEYAI